MILSHSGSGNCWSRCESNLLSTHVHSSCCILLSKLIRKRPSSFLPPILRLVGCKMNILPYRKCSGHSWDPALWKGLSECNLSSNHYSFCSQHEDWESSRLYSTYQSLTPLALFSPEIFGFFSSLLGLALNGILLAECQWGHHLKKRTRS